jgi:Ti-type conjugative transfer relaxase TraA
MAIQFARLAYVSRSNNGNACCKGAYNSRSSIRDSRTNTNYNFSHKGDLLHHEVLLPFNADEKFKDPSNLMNLAESHESRINSQVLKEYVLALPDDKDVSLEIKKEMVYEFIAKNKFLSNGIAIQFNIHSPDEEDKNLHAHLLLTTRKFSSCGNYLTSKTRDINAQVRGGKNHYIIAELEESIGAMWKDIQNSVFESHGLENRVDYIKPINQKHVGPTRMRAPFNSKALENEEINEINKTLITSGEELLEFVTRGASVFKINDLKRALKLVDIDIHDKVLSESLNSAIPLFDSSGNKTEFFTTNCVREEEQKLLRLGGYINDFKNPLIKDKQNISNLINNSNLTLKQKEAITHLLLQDSGIRILRGRAGVGKSHVLGHINTFLEDKLNIIALAPTHKAKNELASVGFKNTDTVKGFLFKLYNDRIELKNNSLILIDEADMPSNSDYSEILRVAAIKNCNVLLSGDEKQLSSIDRGSVFEILGEKLGSFELSEIQRQQTNWGKSVAECFSQGKVAEGIKTLEENNKLFFKKNKQNTIDNIIKDFHNSPEDIKNKLILTIKNDDVAHLNKAARENLKTKGIIESDEYTVVPTGTSQILYFSVGDRVVFTKSEKSLNISNGDFGILKNTSTTDFTVSLDQGNDITFNKNLFTHIRHGYASTVYKAQGASIKDVFVFHDGFSTMKNSYVSMSRHINDLRLYVNKENTRNVSTLVSQLKYEKDYKASINYYTEKELKNVSELNKESTFLSGIISKAYETVKDLSLKILDKHLINHKYYEFKVDPINLEMPISHKTIKKELELIANDNDTKTETTSQEQNQKLSHEITSKLNQEINQNSKDDKFNQRLDTLRLIRNYVTENSPAIVRKILGEPNKYLSNKNVLRYGNSGSLAVSITGNRAGNWYDFSSAKGGDIFDLISEHLNTNFNGAVDYLSKEAQVSASYRSSYIEERELESSYINIIKTQKKIEREEVKKIKEANKLYSKSVAISENSTSHKYLNSRGITSSSYSTDIREAVIFDKELNDYSPALIAFARSKDDHITGYQKILLDVNTNSKVDAPNPKKSYGNIKGSFISINKTSSDITVIAEGLETALSI